MILNSVTRYGISFTVGMGCLLSGAAVVHNILKPDTTIPKIQKPKEEVTKS